MPKTINSIRKAKLKQAILRPSYKSDRQALKDAGFSPKTAHSRVGDCKSLKIVKAEILQEFKASDVTVESVLREIEEIRQLALNKKDLSTAGKMAELKGKYIAMFTDKREVTAQVKYSQEEVDEYNRLRGKALEYLNM